MRLRGEMQSDVLLGDQASADACTQVLIEEAGHVRRSDVAAAFEEAASKNWDCVGVCLDEVRHQVGERGFRGEGGDGGVGEGEERAEGV